MTTLPDRADATFVRARGAVSAQLLAARFQPDGLAATECALPRPDYWFTGVGADADHASVLQLANPDTGPAVADVTVLGRTGPIDVPELRGLTVQGGRDRRGRPGAGGADPRGAGARGGRLARPAGRHAWPTRSRRWAPAG